MPLSYAGHLGRTGLLAGGTGVYGLGDMNPSFFFVPKRSKIIWGIGRTLVLPTATNTTFLG